MEGIELDGHPKQARWCEHFYIRDVVSTPADRRPARPAASFGRRQRLTRRRPERKQRVPLVWPPTGRKVTAVQTHHAGYPGGQEKADVGSQILRDTSVLQRRVVYGEPLRTPVVVPQAADAWSIKSMPPVLREAVTLPAGTRAKVVALAEDFDFGKDGRPNGITAGDEDFAVMDVWTFYYVVHVTDLALQRPAILVG